MSVASGCGASSDKQDARSTVNMIATYTAAGDNNDAVRNVNDKVGTLLSQGRENGMGNGSYD